MQQTPSIIDPAPPKPAPSQPPELAAKFAGYPSNAYAALMQIRGWIFDLAADHPAIREITETLKWGEPSWLTKPKVGTTIRADWKPKAPDQVAIYFNCKTDLIDRARSHFGDILECDGNRAIIIALDRPLPKAPIQICLGWALSYHQDKKAPR
ncbi:DUF1801 domain-containing protein [Thalassospira alkalitolerans]|uniref:DUF1801 domain-containing protein n=1 Tax=Thalassospira alkalitolerans TaxID=1293890 RepID=UPI0030EE44BB|tara:strand:+ start:18312 stop:18770 length:459 start_codon:yes stop_codon:yes gene_type:complete